MKKIQISIMLSKHVVYYQYKYCIEIIFSSDSYEFANQCYLDCRRDFPDKINSIRFNSVDRLHSDIVKNNLLLVI